MKNTDKMFLEKLTEIHKILKSDAGKAEAEKQLQSIFNNLIEDNNVEADNSYNFEKEKSLDVFAIGEDISLCKFRDSDRDSYIKIQKENTIMPAAFRMDGYEDMLWSGVNSEKSFSVSIRRKSDDAYIGYCSIKNIQSKDLELAIELLKKFKGHGYGRKALTLFMKKIKEYSGISLFKALVDAENIASQNMCEACGGIPSGIAEFLLNDKEYMEKYEQDNQNSISDHMRKVASKFGVSPEKLLTHVLVYRFEV